MAKQIGLDNNPTGSAVAFAMGNVFKQWALKHTTGKAHELTSKLSTKALGKALIYANIANAANETVADLAPHINAAATWVGALPANILNQTIGRIPVIGQIFRTLHNFVTEAVSTVADFIGLDAIATTGRTFKISDPNSGFETNINWKTGKTGIDDIKGEDENMKISNKPSWYENLDLHTTFSIPGAYTKKTVVNGTLATPKIIVHRLAENGLADVSALRDRLTQKFTLIKAVRGLSATRYDIKTLANYERVAKLALVEYFTLKKVISAAQTFMLVQVNIGDNIIRSYGFDPQEVRDNLSNYQTLLTQFHRMISNNLPMTGLWRDRVKYLIESNVPDYSNPKVATIHMHAICMSDVFYTNAEGHTTDTLTFDARAEFLNNNYNVMLANMKQVQDVIIANDDFQQLIADYFGAFGKSAIWEDKDYPAYAKPLDLRNADNDLSREQIKNGMYANAKLTVITIAQGVANFKTVVDVDNLMKYQYPNHQFGNTFDVSGAVRPNYDTLLDYDSYLNAAGFYSIAHSAFDQVKVLLPDLNGVGAQVANLVVGQNPSIISMNNHETIYSLHKENYSEGESLEISQFKLRSVGVSLQATTALIDFIITYKTQEYALIDSTVYVFGSNGSNIVDQTYQIMNETFSDDALTNVESAIDFPDEMMLWALIDWMPMTHVTFFGYDSNTQNYSPRDLLLCDMDSFGSLDDRAFATSVNYSIFSLYGAAIPVNGKKRVDNLAEVYKDRPSRKG